MTSIYPYFESPRFWTLSTFWAIRNLFCSDFPDFEDEPIYIFSTVSSLAWWFHSRLYHLHAQNCHAKCCLIFLPFNITIYHARIDNKIVCKPFEFPHHGIESRVPYNKLLWKVNVCDTEIPFDSVCLKTSFLFIFSEKFDSIRCTHFQMFQTPHSYTIFTKEMKSLLGVRALIIL